MTSPDKVTKVLELTQCDPRRIPRSSDIRCIIAMILWEERHPQGEIGDMLGRARTSIVCTLKRYLSLIKVDVTFQRRDKAVRQIWKSLGEDEYIQPPTI